MVADLAQRIGQFTPDPAHALLLAQAQLARIVTRDSLTLAFNEVFRVMSWMFLLALLMVPFCRPIGNSPPASPDAH
jgi:DHA2 family multidrug resistance protein